MDLLSNCLLMASDRRPAGRKVAPLPRIFVKHFSTKFNFVCNGGGSIQKFKDVSRRTGRSLTCQCHWNCRQMRCFNWRLITTKTLGAWCLSAGFISRKDVKQHLLDPCGCLSTSGNSGRCCRCRHQMREPSTTCGSCKMTRPGQLSPVIYGKFMIGQHCRECTT